MDLLQWKKIQNKQSSVTSIKWLCARCGIVKMDDEELCLPDDVLEEASASCRKSQNYITRKNWKNLRVSEKQ
jgi:hypothetical protein